jgi:uncharacterized protein YkwD
MKYSAMLFSIAIISTLLFSCTKDIPVGSQDEVLNTAQVDAVEDLETAKQTLEVINTHRSQLGLSDLYDNSLISKEASEHNDYMIYKDEVSHDYFYEREAYLKDKLSATEVAENVAYAYNSAEAVLNAWLKIDENKNVIEGEFKQLGISVKKNSKGRLFFTSIFVK